MSSQKTEMKEEFAAVAHEMWSGWMKYMFSQCEEQLGGVFIPFKSEQRWKRQMNTEYADLPEGEKESDRVEADRMMQVVSAYFHHSNDD